MPIWIPRQTLYMGMFPGPSTARPWFRRRTWSKWTLTETDWSVARTPRRCWTTSPVSGRITNADAADLDGNGSVTSYDAYRFLRSLNSGVLTLPAGGKTEVQVTVTLTQAQKEALEERFVNGAYVEGFVFAQQLPTAEGVEGTVHSIPVLGFYGNWSDPLCLKKAHILMAYGRNHPRCITIRKVPTMWA